MDDKTIMELVKNSTEQRTLLASLTEDVTEIKGQLKKFETLQEQQIKQNGQLTQMLERLQRGSEHFDRIDERLTRLELADGEKAKSLQKQIMGIVIAAVMGGIIGNIGGIIHWLGGGN